MKLTRKKLTVTVKKFTGHLLGSFAVLLHRLSLGVSSAACGDLAMEFVRTISINCMKISIIGIGKAKI
ncbi:hypothetical protein MSSAC_0785 [Methanosarcina siciliae C2J]|uniref:Uncharacterized protein n=4 Tax=Methanosarcina siciliae TaxID=38027 RepID=A0A0E3PB48_9EURY|nr:hypothetical protein [Methanosarcina siciliae]AKB27476.1 hypothetical protein MSSIT_0757 [Methanosarcina siciliae T4/M]AKB31418.1 hypothetical protein MSSIH_0728 [Methanosarcina siciliae HI350]AKB35375.1 hypothetical protein MSSAC_0785 [Methanosarcina siciliae C2J]